MADNAETASGTGVKVATDKVTYSGDVDENVQLMRPVLVTGAEGSKTVVDLPGDATNGLDVDITRVAASVASGSITANAQSITRALEGESGVSVQITGTWVGTLQFEATVDGTNWVAVNGVGAGTANIATTTTVNGLFRNTPAGCASFRVTSTAWTSGTAVVSIRAALGTGGTFLNQISGVQGGVAHDAVDSGNPQKIGMRALAHGTNPTAVAAADRTDWLANRAGVPFVMGGHPNIQTIRLQFTAAQTNVAIVTVAAGLKIVVTALQVTLDNASTVFPSVRIGFGTASTPTTTGVIGAHGGLPAGGGFSRGDGSGILGVGADDEDLRITTVGAATGGGVEVIVTYHTIES